MAAGPLRQEPQAAARRHGRPARRALLRRPRARPGRAGHHVDARAAADGEHDRAGLARRRRPDLGGVHRGVLRRPGAPVHAPGLQRPPHRLALAPVRQPGLAARARDVDRRGADPPLPDQGARRAAADLPAVLRPLHPHGPGRQLDPGDRQAQVRPQAGGPLRGDARLPALAPGRARRRRLRRRRGEPAVEEPRGVRRAAAGDRERPRHPAGDQGADGAAAALAAGRGPGRDGAAVHGRDAPAASRSPSTPT